MNASLQIAVWGFFGITFSGKGNRKIHEGIHCVWLGSPSPLLLPKTTTLLLVVLPDLKAMVGLKIEHISNRGELQIFGHNTEIMGKTLQRHRQE